MVRFGPFEVHESLGKGGMGTVHRAVRRGPGGFRREVALKRMHARSWTADQREGFLQEARLGGALRHPNVVQTYEVGEVDGSLYLAMSLVRGPTVHRLLRTTGAFPLQAVLELAQQAASALAYLHRDGLIHRDIKASNLLVGADGRVRVADLGIAIPMAAGLDDERGVSGTPSYMAPERFHGMDRPAGDVFALGVVLAEVALGKRLLKGKGPPIRALARAEALDADRHELLEPLRREAPVLATSICNMLARDPDARPLASALVEALDGQAAEGIGLQALVQDHLPPAPPQPQPQPEVAEDPLAGRSMELAQAESALAHGRRVVTLCGPAGSGTTRLARAVVDARHDDPMWVELAHSDVEAAMASMAKAAGVRCPEGAWQEAVMGLAQAWPDRLCVLDGADAAHAVALALAQAGAGPLVVTGTRPLGHDDEVVVHVGPLPDAVAAALLAGELDLPPEEVRAAAQRVDGLPLALTLGRGALIDAAPTERLALLRSLGRSPLPRLVEAMARSWEALPPWGRTAIAQLSAVDGPFPLALAELAFDLPDDAPEALEVVSALHERSLLRWVSTSGGSRFAVMAQACTHAREALPDVVAATRRRLARVMADRYQPLQDGRPVAARLEELRILHDHVLAIATHALEAGDVDTALELATMDGWIRGYNGPVAPGLAFADELGRQVRTPEQQLRQRLITCPLRYGAGDAEGVLQAAKEALELAHIVGPRRWAFMAHSFIGLASLLLDDLDAAEQHHGAALRIARSLSPARAATEEINVANVAQLKGDIRGAIDGYERALAHFESVGDRNQVAIVLVNVGVLYENTGRLRPAKVALERAIDAARQAGHVLAECSATVSLGTLIADEGDVELARKYLASGEALAVQLGHARLHATALAARAVAAVFAREVADAEALLADAVSVAPETHRDALTASVWVARGRCGDWAATVGALSSLPLDAMRSRDSASASAALAHALLRLGRPFDALHHTDRAADRARESRDRAAFAGARALAAWGQLEAGLPHEDAWEESQRVGERADVGPRSTPAFWVAAAAERIGQLTGDDGTD